MRPVIVSLSLAALACDAGPQPAASGAGSNTASAAASARPAGSAAGAARPSAGAGSAPAAPASAEGPARPSRPLNVLYLTIDSMRADMPWNGYPRPIAPNLTKLAAESVVYTHAYSASSYTAKSVATMLTGQHASTLYRSGWFFANYAPANEFITEAMQAKGIRTIGGQAHMYFGRGKGLEQGFDVWEIVPGITFDAQTDNHVTSDKLTKLAMEHLGKVEPGKQFFAWFHYMDPHDKYLKHEESPDFGNKNRDRYDSEIWFTDKHIGELLAWCAKQPWWATTALVISADHGEAFGENDAHRHAFDLWETLTRVPWMWKLPGVAPRRIDVRRSHLDLAPTVMELMGLPPLAGFTGQSLVAELHGADATPRPFIMTELAEDSHNPQVRAIVVGDWKLKVWGNGWKVELYDLASDPGEKSDLSRTRKDKLDELRQIYDAEVAKLPIVEPYGGMKLKGGKEAKGPSAPRKP
ncbi:MAG: sulfatase-like hydrolase/transferase [Polyangiaceae bacterium]|nr:sulfatase-like hydrolase/transferase [Polyangiaceae bacterium]